MLSQDCTLVWWVRQCVCSTRVKIDEQRLCHDEGPSGCLTQSSQTHNAKVVLSSDSMPIRYQFIQDNTNGTKELVRGIILESTFTGREYCQIRSTTGTSSPSHTLLLNSRTTREPVTGTKNRSGFDMFCQLNLIFCSQILLCLHCRKIMMLIFQTSSALEFISRSRRFDWNSVQTSGWVYQSRKFAIG